METKVWLSLQANQIMYVAGFIITGWITPVALVSDYVKVCPAMEQWLAT